MTSEALGRDDSECREVVFLGRKITWTSDGPELEGDPKHAVFSSKHGAWKNAQELIFLFGEDMRNWPQRITVQT